jgi:hypothetical protein
MKKVFLSVFFVLIAGSLSITSALELNLKLSDDVGIEYETTEKITETSIGGTLSLELVEKVNPFFGFGGGIAFMGVLPMGNANFGLLPLFATVQVNPFGGGFFLKGSAGYSLILFFVDLTSENHKGGPFFEFGTGYEFDFGLILQLSYVYTQGSVEYTDTYRFYSYNPNFTYDDYTYTYTYDFIYHKLGFTLGYKFKL